MNRHLCLLGTWAIALSFLVFAARCATSLAIDGVSVPQPTLPPDDIDAARSLQRVGELWPLGESGERLVPGETRVRGFCIRDKTVNATMLQPLKRLRGITQCHFERCRLDPDVWTLLRSTTADDFAFFECALKKADIREVARFDRLRCLDIQGNHLHDEDLCCLQAQRDLEELRLDNNDLIDVVMDTVVKFKKLRSIMFDTCAITDAGVKRLCSLKGITCLGLRNTKITDEAIAYILELPELDELWVDGNDITDACIAHLARLKKLKRLDVSSTKMTKAGIQRLELLHLPCLFAARPFEEWIKETPGVRLAKPEDAKAPGMVTSPQ